MVNLYTKFEVSIYILTKTWKAVQMQKNVENRVVWGGYGSLKVIGNVTIQYSAYNFLSTSILYHFWECSELFVESRQF